MIVRKAKPTDTPGIEAMAQMWAIKYPHLLVDQGRLRNAVRDCVSGARHFAEVVELDGEIRGATMVYVSDHLWAQRKQAHVVFWVSEVAGAGGRMLRDVIEWAEPRRSIRFIGICPDLEIDRRALSLAERIGFKRRGSVYVRVNGGDDGAL